MPDPRPAAPAVSPLLENGRPRYGIFDAPVGPIRQRDYRPRTPMGRPAGPLARRLGFRHFQFLGAVSPTLFVACGTVRTALFANAFVYVFDPNTGRMQRAEFETPLAIGFTYNPDPDDGVARFKKGSNLVEIHANRSDGSKRLRVRLKDGLAIDLGFHDAPPFEPMRICTRTGPAGWAYAQKVAGVPADGHVECAWGRFDLAEIGAHAHHDFTVGFLRRETWWHWACLSGTTRDGARVGLNLSCGTNETTYSENCVWHDDRRIPVSGTAFEFDEDDLMRPWRVRSTDGSVDLAFTPLGSYVTRRNLFVAAASFHQIFGRFEGTIPGRDGPIKVADVYGFTERQYTKW